jgi:hypothetical protein
MLMVVTCVCDEYIFGFEVAVVDVFIKEVAAALGELEEQRDGFGFRDVSIFFEVGL